MADNFEVTAGTGTKIRAVEKDTDKKHQVVVLDLGGAGAEALLVLGQALMEASLSVTMASNQDAIEVDGTVTANLGATDNAVLDAMVATLGVTDGAKVITDANGTIQQYLRGLVALAIDATPSPVVLTTSSAIVGATMDAGPSWTPAYLHYTSADASGGADLTATPTSGQKIVIDDLILSCGADLVITLEEETSGTNIMVIYMVANSTVQITPRGKIKLPTVGRKLRIDASGAGAVSVTTCYHSEV